MEYDRGESFLFDFEPNGIPFGSENRKENCHPPIISHSIKKEREYESFLSVLTVTYTLAAIGNNVFIYWKVFDDGYFGACVNTYTYVVNCNVNYAVNVIAKYTQKSLPIFLFIKSEHL